jgi:hypothetical protein
LATTVTQSETHPPVELKDAELAAFLAWMLPGLGHFYQGRYAKAGLYFVCIMGLFLHGLYLGSEGGHEGVGWARVVYFAGTDRLPFVCQVGIGLPVLPAIVQYFRVSNGHQPWLNGFMAPPVPPDRARADEKEPRAMAVTTHELHFRLNRSFELGTVYTMVAGLLNVLVIYDAWGGPVFPEPAKRKEDDDDDEGETSAKAPAEKPADKPVEKSA